MQDTGSLWCFTGLAAPQTAIYAIFVYSTLTFMLVYRHTSQAQTITEGHSVRRACWGKEGHDLMTSACSATSRSRSHNHG
jgi:hypothetical protein